MINKILLVALVTFCIAANFAALQKTGSFLTKSKSNLRKKFNIMMKFKEQKGNIRKVVNNNYQNRDNRKLYMVANNAGSTSNKSNGQTNCISYSNKQFLLDMQVIFLSVISGFLTGVGVLYSRKAIDILDSFRKKFPSITPIITGLIVMVKKFNL